MKKMLKKVIVFVVLPLALCTTTPAVTCGSDCGPMPGYSWPPTDGECQALFNWCMCDCTAQTGGGPCYSACTSWARGFGCPY